MRKGWICALMTGLLLLCGCSGNGGERKDEVQLLQEEYQSLSACDMQAKVRCDNETEVVEYLLQCHWSADGTSSVEILEPEMLAGICAQFDREQMTLVYEDMSLAAGQIDDTKLSPANILPMMMDGIREGYILEKGADALGEENCLRLLFDTTNGEQPVKYVVWFGTGHAPVKAELIVDNTVIFTAEILQFFAEDAPKEDTTEEDASVIE